ncbi:MAG: ester cyclase [Candidatus Dormibacteraeota bacterium]|nr:ester cyclase [Candidatus Dormibacteraeota bacterium]
MTTDQNRAIVRRYYDEVLNGRSVAVLDEIALDDYIENDPFPGMGNGREQLKLRASALLSAFSPCTFKIEDIVAEGDRVAVRWRSRGTQSGEFMGIPPTNRPYEIAGIDFHRLVDGRMAEHWHVVDQLSQLQQLGLLPSPQGAPA